MAVLLSIEQARERLFSEGKTIAAFCKEHDLNQSLVSNVLAGRIKGKWGEARRAAILLGMKEGKIV
ncbi:hypothetical protein LMG33818_002649 [Halomonadaceae bacterium LMG 33818]|uniref:hypothetical protein n=1 Tax=Cernens ardua TaxID=3402176 RepID=UPI003EDB8922